MIPQDIISDDEIARVHGNANFGSMSPREVVNDGVRKYAVGYSGGHTQVCILREHGLIKKPRGWKADLTEKGKAYARALGWPDLSGGLYHPVAAEGEVAGLREALKEIATYPSGGVGSNPQVLVRIAADAISLADQAAVHEGGAVSATEYHRRGVNLIGVVEKAGGYLCRAEKAEARVAELEAMIASYASDFKSQVADSWQSLLDADDRNSPEEYPEHCLITFEELSGYMGDAAFVARASYVPHSTCGTKAEGRSLPIPPTTQERIALLTSLVERQQEELRMIRMKDTNAVYDTTLRIDVHAALLDHREER